MFKWSIIKQIVVVVLIIGGLITFGMKGLLIGFVITSWFTFFVNIGLVSKYIGYKWYRQIKDLSPVAIASSSIALFSYVCGYLLHLGLYPDGMVKFLVYAILYLGWSFMFKPEAFTYTVSILPLDKIKKRFGKK